MNKVMLAGRLTRDPEVRYSQGAEPVAVTRFSVAINKRFKRDGESDADFINCVSFGKTAEFISKYFAKGMMIGIVGSLRTNSWTDNNGQKRVSTDVHVEEAEFLESRASSNGYQNNNLSNNNSANISNNMFGNLPSTQDSDEFYSIEESVDDDNLPF